MSRSAAPLTCWLIASIACAQSLADDATVRHVEPLNEAGMAAAAVTLKANSVDPSASFLTWRGNQLPLPVTCDRVAVGLLGDDRLAVLAAGVRESLVIYVVEESGAIARLATEGGRRLPPSFNGEGSWPLAVGRQVFIGAYAKDGLVELRAFGFGEKVFASRSLPAGVVGLEVRVDARLRISVTAIGATGLAPIEFTHPNAPRVEFGAMELEFGEVRVASAQRGVTSLSNPGAEAIEVDIDVDGAFRVDTKRVRIAAGGSADVVVEFWPDVAREHRGSLSVRHPGLGRALVLPLRGTGVRAAPMVDASFPGEPVAVASSADHATRRSDAEAERGGDGRSAPSSFVEDPDAGRAGPSGENRAPDRQVQPAQVLAVLVHASPPPKVTQDGAMLVLNGNRGELLVLAAVTMQETPDGRRPALPRSVWRVRMSAVDGEQRVPLRSLGLKEGEAVIALRKDQLGVVESHLLVPDLTRSDQSGD